MKNTEEPTEAMFISYPDLIARLRAAGWEDDEIKAHLQEIAEDCESGE